MPVSWSDEKLILLYCPGRGSNSRPPAHSSFKHGQGVLCPYPLGHGGGLIYQLITISSCFQMMGGKESLVIYVFISSRMIAPCQIFPLMGVDFCA